VFNFSLYTVAIKFCVKKIFIQFRGCLWIPKIPYRPIKLRRRTLVLSVSVAGSRGHKSAAEFERARRHCSAHVARAPALEAGGRPSCEQVARWGQPLRGRDRLRARERGRMARTHLALLQLHAARSQQVRMSGVHAQWPPLRRILYRLQDVVLRTLGK